MKQERLASQGASSRAANPSLRPLHRTLHLRPPAPRGGLRRAALEPGAGCTAPWSTHALAPRLRYLLACPVAAPSALVLVSEHLEA